MEAFTGRELLCIPGKNKNYAVEIPYVTELCIQMRISLLPCLPDHFAGVCNYKGNIVPVVELESGQKEETRGKRRDMVLLMEWGRYRMGIHFTGEPYVVSVTEADKIESPEEMEPSGIWAEKQIYKAGDAVVFLIDIEKKMESLVIFP